MELVYIKPSGVWKGLASNLTVDWDFGKQMMDPSAYGAIRRDSAHGSYFVMTEKAYLKAQRDCFKYFYRNASRKLMLSYNEIIRDRTIACNLLLMKYDMQSLETGGLVLRDASPYMAKLIYNEIRHISPDEYEKSIIEFARNFARHIEMLRNDGNLFIMETKIKPVEEILSGKIPFALPKLDSIRKYDRHIASNLLASGSQYEYICQKVSEYSLLPVCMLSDSGYDDYVRKIVAEVIFEHDYPERIESQWAREVNAHIQGIWLNNPDSDDMLPIPCRIVGKTAENKIKVLASDADAELGLPYSRDDIYEVDQSWLLILTKNEGEAEWLMEAGIDSCKWI